VDINNIIEAQGEQMDAISFGELVKELTGVSFEELFKEYNLNKGKEKNEERKD
jgi:ribosomal protein L12E/L44/L45/RPP1/RPP2